MKVYRITDPGTARYTVDVERKWHLPGVRCEFCDEVWTGLGLDYPSVDLSTFPLEASCRSRVVNLSEYRLLRQALLEWLPQRLLVRPGAGFGPLTGRIPPTSGGLVWVKGWALCVSGEVLKSLKRETRGIRSQRISLTKGGKRREPLFELELLPSAELHSSVIPFDLAPPCEECGRWPLKVPDRIALKTSSLPEQTDVFRGSDLTTAIFATERFVTALQGCGVDRFTVEAVEIVGNS